VPDPRPAPASVASEERVRALAAVLLQDARRFHGALRGRAAAAGSFLDVPIKGQSMGAAIPDGGVVRVSLEGGEAAAVGDVVISGQGDQLVAHRVVYRGRRGRAAGYLMTRGDARIAPDPPVPLGRVLGRVTALAIAGAYAPVPPAPRTGWRGRWARATLVRADALALHVRPALAARLAGLMTAAERRRFPMVLFARLSW